MLKDQYQKLGDLILIIRFNYSLIFDKITNAHIRSRYLHEEIKESVLSARDCKALRKAQQLKQNPYER